MKNSLPFIRWFYSLLLNLFPRKYRHEFGEELQAVFVLSIADAAKAGSKEIVKVLLRELVSFPQAVLFEHLRERRKTGMTKKKRLALFRNAWCELHRRCGPYASGGDGVIWHWRWTFTCLCC